MEDDKSVPTMNTPTMKTGYNPDILRHRLYLCRQVTLPHFTQGWVKVVDKVSCHIYTKPKSALWTGLCVRLDNGIQEVVANKPYEILQPNFSTVEKKL